MTDEWRAVILAADASNKAAVTPDMPKRIDHVLRSGFISRYTQVNGMLVPAELEKGTYPNNQQIKRVLTTEYSRLQRLIASTTKGHFNRALRALTSRNWKGVAGPGHTWAIDSTIGDIYLRSSLNPAWIVGRPIVYVIVDVWSTAVVGFYVCLTGPSWATAKVSLFNAVCDPHLLGDLWGYQPILCLEPHPTFPSVLLCDRGEYLSRGAFQTGAELKIDMSYTPPYHRFDPFESATCDAYRKVLLPQLGRYQYLEKPIEINDHLAQLIFNETAGVSIGFCLVRVACA